MFEFGDQVSISKYKNILTKGHAPNFAEEVSWLKKLKILFHGLMLLAILPVKKFLEPFMKKNSKQKQIAKNLESKK